MQIGYARWTMNNTLILGILWTLVGAFRLYEYMVNRETKRYKVVFMFLGPIFLAHYLFQKGMKYVTFSDQHIQINHLWPQLIWITDLRTVNYDGADYHFISKSGKKIVINKESLDQKMVAEFDEKFFMLKDKLESAAVSDQKSTAYS